MNLIKEGMNGEYEENRRYKYIRRMNVRDRGWKKEDYRKTMFRSGLMAL